MASSMINMLLGIDASKYFEAFGLIAASYLALKIALTVIKVLKSIVFAGSTNFKKLGSWAVVTGATDGIGKAYAKELARRGINIVLISRSEGKLQDVADEIEERLNACMFAYRITHADETKYLSTSYYSADFLLYRSLRVALSYLCSSGKESKVKTRIIVADFGKGLELYDSIRSQLDDLEIGTLVNNVGMSYPFPNYFLEIPDREEFCMRMININVTSMTMMSSIVMPGMVERRRGVIINLSSAAGMSPKPLLTVYSACKAYVSFFSQCIQSEYQSKGITCQCVMPYFVATKMSKIKRPSLFAPSSDTYVKAALSTVGVSEVTHGYWTHSIQGMLLRLLPEFIEQKLMMRIFLNARKINLKKRESKKD